jgi:ribosomal protein S18 acetylase RimI-like enzyme
MANNTSFGILSRTLSEQKLKLRAVRETDTNSLYALFCDVRSPGLSTAGLEQAVTQNLLSLQYRGQQATYGARFPEAAHYIIEQPSGEAIGHLLINDSDQAPLHLVDIALLSQWRRRGIGSLIVRALQMAASRRSASLQLSVACDNPALALYQRLNLIETSRDEMYVTMIWEA